MINCIHKFQRKYLFRKNIWNCNSTTLQTAVRFRSEAIVIVVFAFFVVVHSARKICFSRVNLVDPLQPSPTYTKFATTYFYFLLPKNLQRRLRDGINFVANSVFQADHVGTGECSWPENLLRTPNAHSVTIISIISAGKSSGCTNTYKKRPVYNISDSFQLVDE